MFAFTILLKFKPNTDLDEMSKACNELLSIILSEKIPGLKSANCYKNTAYGDTRPEWDYVYMALWDNKEAWENSLSDKVNGPDAKRQREHKDLYDKLGSAVEKIIRFGSSIE